MRLDRILTTIAAVGLTLWAPTVVAGVFNPETFRLGNGMQVVVIPIHRAPVVSHMVFYRVGAADEEPGRSGLAHFLEHLMFKGTAEMPPGEFSRIVDRNGGNDNAFTSWDYTGYYQNVPKDKLELVMRMEADRMRNLELDDAIVLPERDVVLEERRQRIDNIPASKLNEQMSAALYLNHPYGRPIIGWEDEVRALTTEDARAFYRRHYMPNNAILLVAGDVTVGDVMPLAQKYYGAIPPGDLPPRFRPQEPPQQAARIVVIEDPEVRQPRWRRSYLAPSYNVGNREHAYSLEVLSEVLGGGATSRLYRSLVVEQQLAISVGASYDAMELDASEFNFYAAPRDGVDLEQLGSAIEAEIDRLLSEGLTEEEVARARDRLIIGATYARDSLTTGVRILGMALTTGLTIADVEAWPERIEAVTAEQVTAAARAVFKLNRSVTGLLKPAADDKRS